MSWGGQPRPPWRSFRLSPLPLCLGVAPIAGVAATSLGTSPPTPRGAAAVSPVQAPVLASTDLVRAAPSLSLPFPGWVARARAIPKSVLAILPLLRLLYWLYSL